MPEVGSASLAIIPSFKGFQSNLENGTGKAMTAAGATGGTAFGDSAGRSAGSKFRSHVKNFAKIAAVGFAAAGAVAFKFAGDALDEAREAQKVGALTASTIKSTGGAANVTRKQIDKLTDSISRKAGIDDEVIARGANMLLTFKNVRNEAGKGNKIFDRTTRAITDLAAGMAGGKGGDLDLKSSSILLGKALNDPVKGLSALTRVGIQFTDQQKAINKALVEGGELNALAAFGSPTTVTEINGVMKEHNATLAEAARIILGDITPAQEKLFKHYVEGGHAIEAQKNILREVNSQFKGAAAAQATEADKSKVAWGNLKEEVGTELIPVMDDLAVFLRKKGIPAAQDFIGWFKEDGVPALKKFGGFVKTAAGHARDLVGFLNDLPKPAKIAGLVGLFGGIAALKLRGGGGGALGGLGKAVGLAKPVPVFVTNPGLGGAGGVGGPAGKTGGGLAKLAGPFAVAAGAAALSKKVGINGAGIPDASNPEAFAKTAVKLVEIKNHLFGSNGVTAGILRANDAASKLPNQLDQGKNSAERLASEIFKIDRSDPKVDYRAPGLDELLRKTRDYDSLLDGLNNRTITTFLRTTRVKNDIGESGDPRFHNASGTPWWHGNGSTWVGENGPEVVTLPRGSSITPANQVGDGYSAMFDFRGATVMAHDYSDFVSKAQARAQRAALDGRRP